MADSNSENAEHRTGDGGLRHAQDPPADLTSGDPSTWPLGRLLSTTARQLERTWNAHLSGWNLNHASHPVLLYLLTGPASARELAVRVQVTDQTMSRILARLERQGLVARTTHDTDRRRLDVHITAAGRTAALEAADPTKAEGVVTDALSPAQLEQLRSALVTVVEYHRNQEKRP